MPLRNLLTIFLAAVISLACYHRAERNRYVATVGEAMRLINRHYVEDLEPRSVFENAMNGMVDKLDTYSAYFTPESKQQVEESLDQEFGGVGIVVETNSTTNRLTVLSPLVGTPAYKAGIRANDTILEIDGNSTEGMSLRDSVRLMRGKAGSIVKLIIQRPGQDEPLHFDLARAVIPVESVLGDTRNPDGVWNYVLAENPRIGYVRLTTFGKHSTEELTRTLKFEKQPVDAVILDLRNNAGGLLNAAVEICEMFLEPGDRIVSTRGRDGRVLRVYEAKGRPSIDPKLPVVVLTNRYSASASEIVAACLQDHDRAVIVGERTWGKGTVQNIFELEGGRSAIKLTTASYWRPSGKNIHRLKKDKDEDDWGVRPNPGLEIKLSDEDFEKVLKQRQKRDVLRSDDGKEPNGKEPAARFDPQLVKAIEYLEAKLAK